MLQFSEVYISLLYLVTQLEKERTTSGVGYMSVSSNMPPFNFQLSSYFVLYWSD